MRGDHTPFLILGGGAAAFAAATRANDLGIDTVLLNDGLPLGGTCVNVGCVPTKHLLAMAEEIHVARRPRRPGGHAASFDSNYPALKAARDALVAGLRRSNYNDVLDVLTHVEAIAGRGTLVDVTLAGARYEVMRAVFDTLLDMEQMETCRDRIREISGMDLIAQSMRQLLVDMQARSREF